MSYMDLRDAIESAIPAWFVLLVIGLAVAVMVYGIATRGRRK